MSVAAVAFFGIENGVMSAEFWKVRFRQDGMRMTVSSLRNEGDEGDRDAGE